MRAMLLAVCLLGTAACGSTTTTSTGGGATQRASPTAITRRAGFLGGLSQISTVASTIPANGDENPYAITVAPVSSGSVQKGDILVDNFNARSNEQGTGTTIMDISPNGSAKLFAAIPAKLSGCPGGVGLTTAMTMLETGWVIVGSTPSTDGTTTTAGAGCLIVLNSGGQVVSTISGPRMDGPWDMATVDSGTTAALFLTNTLIGVKAPGQPGVDEGNLLRITLRVPSSAAPTVTAMTVIGSGFPEQASSGAFVVGPTGVAYASGTVYVSNPLTNSINAIPDAMTRTRSAGTGRIITTPQGFLNHPLAMVMAPNGDLLVTNALDGDIVEVSTTGRQVAEYPVDADPAQSPPGSGDLFGLAVSASGNGIYFAKDDTNTLALLHG